MSADRERIARDLEQQIAETHRRYVAAMTARVAKMSLEQRERYFVALSSLTSRLEDTGKTLREVAQEAMTEVVPFVVAEIQSG